MDGRLNLKESLCRPLLAPILADVRLALFLAGFGVLHLALTAWGIPLWQCPVKSSLGISCPGCGLTTAMVFLLCGDWGSALSAHAFSPLFLPALPLLLVSVLLPRSLRRRAARRVADLERRTGFAGFILLSMLVYGIMRLLY